MTILLIIIGVLALLGAGWYYSIRDLWREWPGLHDLNTEDKNG